MLVLICKFCFRKTATKLVANNTDLNTSVNNANGDQVVSMSLSPESQNKDAAGNLATDPETDYFLPVSKVRLLNYFLKSVYT